MRQRFLRFPAKTVWFQPLAGGLMVGTLSEFLESSGTVFEDCRNFLPLKHMEVDLTVDQESSFGKP